MAKINKLLKEIIFFILIYYIIKINFFNEPIILFYSYLFLYKKRYLVFSYSSLLFLLYKDSNLFLKNTILFLLFEIFNIIFSDDKYKIMEYYVFLLTFFIYLVLINIFEPMIYNLSRIRNSILIYIIILIMCKLDLKFCKIKRCFNEKSV